MLATLPLALTLSLAAGVEIKATTAERSKDSSRTDVTIRLDARELSVRRERTGRRAASEPPRRLELDDATRAKIVKYLDESHLDQAQDVDEAFEPPGSELTFTMTFTLGGKRRTLRLHGPLSSWDSDGPPPFTKRPEVRAAQRLVSRLEALVRAP